MYINYQTVNKHRIAKSPFPAIPKTSVRKEILQTFQSKASLRFDHITLNLTRFNRTWKISRLALLVYSQPNTCPNIVYITKSILSISGATWHLLYRALFDMRHHDINHRSEILVFFISGFS